MTTSLQLQPVSVQNVVGLNKWLLRKVPCGSHDSPDFSSRSLPLLLLMKKFRITVSKKPVLRLFPMVVTLNLGCTLEAFGKLWNYWHSGPTPRGFDLIGLGWNLDQSEVDKIPSWLQFAIGTRSHRLAKPCDCCSTLTLQKTEGRLESSKYPLQGHISTPTIKRDEEPFSLSGLSKEPPPVTS